MPILLETYEYVRYGNLYYEAYLTLPYPIPYTGTP